ncbi:MAG: hypothetical protein EGQ91_01525 [Clostridiales bacterium]|nr:hypothetical protein [Clostridiales bacterium]
MNKSAAKIIYIKDMVKIEYMSMLLDVAQNDKDLEIANLVDFLIKKQCKPIGKHRLKSLFN